MQIVLTNQQQKFAISPITEADFNGNTLKVTFRGQEVYCKPAAPGEMYYIKRDNSRVSIIKANIPSEKSKRIAWLLSFNTSDFCQTFEEFKKRSMHLQDKKEGYKSKHFVEVVDVDEEYAFLIAEKFDRQKYKPLLIYVKPNISKVKYEELVSIYNSYRKVYNLFTAEYINVLLG